LVRCVAARSAGSAHWVRNRPQDEVIRAILVDVEKPSVRNDDFQVGRRAEGGAQVFSVQGEIDLATAPVLLQHVVEPAEPLAGRVVVDLSDVSFLDSTGLGALITIDEKVRAQGGVMVLVVQAPNVLKVFDITGLTASFSIFPSLAEALRSLTRWP
jgi:anti-sigma B factor antagonist